MRLTALRAGPATSMGLSTIQPQMVAIATTLHELEADNKGGATNQGAGAVEALAPRVGQHDLSNLLLGWVAEDLDR